MADRGEKAHNVRMDETRWARLAVLARSLVHESEMPHGTRPATDNRIGPMMRMIADGQIVLTRLGREAPEEG